ncbi:MAG: YwaF family protein [Clostridiales bacterium]|nr:YwaF family protein [Clostridiales bacterium]
MSYWEIFWAYIDTLYAHGIKGYGLFSVYHILWLFFLLAITVVYTFIYLRGGNKRRDDLRKILALFLIFFEIFKICVMALTGAPLAENLPLEVCSFAEYVILINAIWPQSRIFNQLLVLEFLPAAVIALLVPTSAGYPALNFYAIHQMLMHGAIVTYIVARYAAGEIKPRYIGIWQTAIALICVIIPIYLIDITFDKGFMFLRYHYDNPVLKMLWNVSGGTGGMPYIIALTVFVIIMIHFCFLVYVIIDKISKRKKPDLSEDIREED